MAAGCTMKLAQGDLDGICDSMMCFYDIVIPDESPEDLDPHVMDFLLDEEMWDAIRNKDLEIEGALYIVQDFNIIAKKGIYRDK